MKENTKMGISMAKEFIDSWMEVSIEESGATTRKTGKEYTTTQMETHMTVILSMESNMVKDCINMQQDNTMKDNINLIWNMEWEKWNLPMEISIQVDGREISLVEKEGILSIKDKL